MILLSKLFLKEENKGMFNVYPTNWIKYIICFDDKKYYSKYI